MNRETFDVLVEETVKRTAAILVAKGAEYASDGDRLANFKRNAARNGHTVLEEWMTYWNKHIDSIHSYMARVRDQATRLALQQVVDLAERASSPTERSMSVDPELFRAIVDKAVPDAIRFIDTQLSEPIEGRFDDNINYSILCQALLAEMKGK